jgi:hypothetical protein
MNDLFERRVRAASVAAWWVVLCGVLLLTVIWLVYLALVSDRPAWMLAMCGPDVTRDLLQTVSLWFIAVFKLFLWLLFLMALWMTLWARQLRKFERQK